MSGVNKVILIGNLGKDPEVKYLESGVAVANITLATTENYKNKEGEKVSQTVWHDIVLWRGLAEIAEKYSFGEIRVTHEQNLVLPHVKSIELFEIWKILDSNKLDTPNIKIETNYITTQISNSNLDLFL